MKLALDRIFEAPADDPEVVRKARFLNVCLFAVGVAAFVLAVISAITILISNDVVARILVVYEILTLLGSLFIYWLNRHGWHRPAGYLFLALIIYIITAATRPAIYLFEGSTILAYVLPIIMASVILEPWSSFVITTAISVLLYIVARLSGITEHPTAETLATMYMLAVVAWLSARNLNQALRQAHDRAEELRLINLELDKRVAERTKDLEQTNRQLAEALRRERSESSKNQAVLEGIADGVIVFDDGRRAIVANPAMESMMSLPLKDILGKRITQLIETEGNSEAVRVISTAFSTRLASPVRFNFQHGSQIITASLASIDLPGEEMRGVAAVFHDITKEVEADRAKSEFVSTVSHELRTPLTSIKGYTDLLILGAMGVLNEGQRKFMQIIKVNADRLTALLTDLLDISRMETGRLRLDMRELSMPDIVNDVVTSLRPEIEKKGLRLSVEVAPNLSPVRGDRSRIVQIVSNLVSNAYRYTPSGGQIKISVSQRDSTLRVDVADTGIGIAPKDQAKLFQRFYRADDPRVREVSGTGLGLAITRMFVELHGGKVWVQSELNKGSTFTFILPTVQPLVGREASLGPGLATAQPSGSKRKILVVEDDQNVAELIRYHLEGDHYQVAVIGRGREVMPSVLTDPPDMITLDVLLPDMDGFEILRELKESPVTARIPVIVLSVLHDRETGLQMGAADYLTKPIRGQDLVESVKRAFGALEEAKGQEILVVDDEPDVRRWLRDALKVCGFRVAEAGDGLEALQQVARSRPDLILLDLKMPRMDGYTVIKKLKSDKAMCDIPVVVLTASSISKEQDKLHLLDMGAKRFLTKPISIEMLVAEIQQQLAAQVQTEAATR